MKGFDFTTDHWYVNDVPGDPEQRNVRRQVSGAGWSPVEPTATGGPTLIAHSPEVAAQLGIDEDTVTSDQFARVFSGNELVDGMQPHAMNYGGH